MQIFQDIYPTSSNLVKLFDIYKKIAHFNIIKPITHKNTRDFNMVHPLLISTLLIMSLITLPRVSYSFSDLYPPCIAFTISSSSHNLFSLIRFDIYKNIFNNFLYSIRKFKIIVIHEYKTYSIYIYIYIYIYINIYQLEI